MPRLPDFEAWAIFAQVAEYGSFVQAAQALSLSRPTVSRAVSRLEESLGVALFQRTSRQLSLTSAGRNVLDYARRLLDEGRAAEEALREESTPPRGHVKVTAPVTFGIQYLAPLLPRFMEVYPNVTLEVDFSDAAVDLVAEGYDLALRIASLANSSLRMRRLCKVPRYLVAHPAWCQEYHELRHPREIEDHMKVVYRSGGASSGLRFTNAEDEHFIMNPRLPRLYTNNAEAFLPFIENGNGVGLFPAFMVQKALAQERVQIVLQEWQADAIALHILTPPNARRPARVAVLMEWLARQLKDEFWV